MGAGAQIEFSLRQGSTILNTTNMEPRHRDVIDGVTKMQRNSSMKVNGIMSVSQARYSANSKGSYTPYTTMELDQHGTYEQARERQY